MNSAEKYVGKENLTVGNGQEVKISHIGTSSVQHPSKTITLQNVIYSPEIKKNLLSVYAFTSQNKVVEFDYDFFIVKDKSTKKATLQGRLKDGLYQLSYPQFCPTAPSS